MPARQFLPGLAAVALLAGSLLAPLPLLSPLEQRAVGVALFALVLWTAQPVPVEVSSLAVLLLLPAVGLLDFAHTFAPFGGTTVWLIFAGMVLSLLLSHTGLGERLAAACLPLLAGGGRLRLLAGLHLLGLGSAFFVPSGVVRVLLLMPVGIALCRALDPEGRDPALGPAVTLSLVCSTYFGGCGVLTGSVPNLVVAAQLEAVTGRVVLWGEWLRWMFPVIGALRTALCLLVVWLLCGRRLRRAGRAPARVGGRPALERRQWRAVALLLLGVVLWASDIVHGLAPVWVGLGLVLLAVAPVWGPLSPGQLKEVNYPFFFYVAALFGVGAALDRAGFSLRMVTAVLEVLPPGNGHWLGEHLRITAAVVPLDFLMDIAAVGAVATPSTLQVGAAAGLDPLATALSVAMATTVVFLPYQAAPFMVALGYGTVSLRLLAAAMLLISVSSLFLLCPLNVAYWRASGLL